MSEPLATTVCGISDRLFLGLCDLAGLPLHKVTELYKGVKHRTTEWHDDLFLRAIEAHGWRSSMWHVWVSYEYRVRARIASRPKKKEADAPRTQI
jgi:hypothetical protein